MYFVYGCGGTNKIPNSNYLLFILSIELHIHMHIVLSESCIGKTFLWKTIIVKLRSKGRIILAIASLRFVSLLLQDGRTTHLTFKIPIKLDDTTGII